MILLLDQRDNRFRLIDNLDSGLVDNISDILRFSANEKAGAGGLAAESGRICALKQRYLISFIELHY